MVTSYQINIFEEDKDLIALNVYDSKSKSILISKSITFTALKSMQEKFNLEFNNKKSQVLEFRVYWHKNCDIAVSKIVLEKK